MGTCLFEDRGGAAVIGKWGGRMQISDEKVMMWAGDVRCTNQTEENKTFHMDAFWNSHKGMGVAHLENGLIYELWKNWPYCESSCDTSASFFQFWLEFNSYATLKKKT